MVQIRNFLAGASICACASAMEQQLTRSHMHNRHHGARAASDEVAQQESSALPQTRDTSSKHALVSEHLQDHEAPMDDDDAFIDLTVRDVPRPRHRPREFTDSSATQVRLMLDFDQ